MMTIGLILACAFLVVMVIMNIKDFDLVTHLYKQRAFSLKTFGPGERPAQVVAHIRKELIEIEQKPDDLLEWIDVLLLAFDGALRQGYSPEAIAAALEVKLQCNMARTWPDWRTVPAGQPVEHDRTQNPDIRALNRELMDR